MTLVKVIYSDVTEYEEVGYDKDLEELKPVKFKLIGWLLKKDCIFNIYLKVCLFR